jgi:hypothetical protein
MGFHSFDSVETKSETLIEARRDMWAWAEPIIADRAADAYQRHLPDGVGAMVLARKQCRLWRNIIHDQTSAAALVTHELRRASLSFGLDQEVTEDVNNDILEELIDIILCRYRASRNSTKTFSMILMAATSCLGAVRAAA